MKIAIYETVHLDWVIPLCELFSVRSDEVSFFTNVSFEKDIKEALKENYKLFHWRYVDPEVRLLPHLQQLKAFLNSDRFDYIILNSVESRHLLVYAAILPKRNPKIFINLHDVNNFFNAHYSFKFRALIKKAGKELLKTKAAGFIVNAKAMKAYIESNKLTSKPVFWLPPVIEKTRLTSSNFTSPLITITIPGSIDQKRRDYISVLNVFEKIHQTLPASIEIVLAGRPVGLYGTSVLTKVKAMIDQGMRVLYSSKEIEEKDFQELIASSTILLAPLKVDTSIHDNIKEQYGISKVSGNIYDAIRHGKPLIVPSSLIVPEEIKTSCLYYTSEEHLFEQIIVLATNKQFLRDLTLKALKNSKQFSETQVSKKLSLILEYYNNL